MIGFERLWNFYSTVQYLQSNIWGTVAPFIPTWQQWPVFPLRNLYAEQIFVLVRMQLRKHVDTQTLKCFKRYNSYGIYIYIYIYIYIFDIKFGLLQAHKNEISLRKWPGGTAQSRTLKGTLTVTDGYVVLIPLLQLQTRRHLMPATKRQIRHS